MESPPRIPDEYRVRFREVIDVSWRVFVSRFVGQRHPISTEAPFQHHFANVISAVGNLYCVGRDEVFLVDLEGKCESIREKGKYLDITCSFINQNAKCALELKFKTERQAAQDHGRIDAYADIEALELACKAGFDFGVFYMITDSKTYVRQSTKGVGTVFA